MFFSFFVGELASVVLAFIVKSEKKRNWILVIGTALSFVLALSLQGGGAPPPTPTIAIPVTEFVNTPVPTLPPKQNDPSAIITVIDQQGNSIEMRLVSAGEFIMGTETEKAFSECQKYRSDCQEDWFLDVAPEHTVYLESFYIDKYEVTNRLYLACMTSGACPVIDTYSYTHKPYLTDDQYKDYPVINSIVVF